MLASNLRGAAIVFCIKLRNTRKKTCNLIVVVDSQAELHRAESDIIRSLASAATPIPDNTVKAVIRPNPPQRFRAGIAPPNTGPLQYDIVAHNPTAGDVGPGSQNRKCRDCSWLCLKLITIRDKTLRVSGDRCPMRSQHLRCRRFAVLTTCGIRARLRHSGKQRARIASIERTIMNDHRRHHNDRLLLTRSGIQRRHFLAGSLAAGAMAFAHTHAWAQNGATVPQACVPPIPPGRAGFIHPCHRRSGSGPKKRVRTQRR